MTRMFEEVFPPLSLDQSLLDLLGQVKVEKLTSNRAKNFIRVYLLSGKLYEKYTDLSTYGVRIEKTTAVYGGTRSKITNEIHGIFCRRSDAVSFMEYIRELPGVRQLQRHKTLPNRIAVEFFCQIF